MREFYVGDVTDKALACPFCGERDTALFDVEDRLHDLFLVRCVSCGGRGPKGMTEQTAIDNWNRRKEEK